MLQDCDNKDWTVTRNAKASLVVNAIAQKIPPYFFKPPINSKQGYSVL